MNAPDRIQWLEQRRTGIGGSDVAAILGLSKYKTAVDVWLDKTGQTPIQDEMSEPAYWGVVLEDVVAREYAQRTEQKVQRVQQIIRHPEHDFMLANIDRAVVENGSRARITDGRLLGAKGGLECKTASAFKASDWGREDDPDAIPTEYAAQVMWYLGVTGLEWWDVAALIGGQRFIIKRVERDEETIRSMQEQVEEFWRKHVIERISPEPKTAADALALYPQDSGAIKEADSELLKLLGQAKDLRAQIDALSLELEGDKKKGVIGVMDRIKALIGDASEIRLGDTVLATWKAQESNRFDSTSFKAAHPELYQQFMKSSVSRVFRFK